MNSREAGCYPGCFYYADSCFRKDCFKGNNAMTSPDIMTVAYIIKGFWSKASEIDLDPSKLGTEGEIGLMQELIRYERLDSEVFKKNPDVAGVWAYEISEPFGEWVAEFAKSQGKLPPHEACLAQLQSLVDLIDTNH